MAELLQRALKKPLVKHLMTISQGDWTTAKCTCRWYRTGWDAKEVERAAKAHIRNVNTPGT